MLCSAAAEDAPVSLQWLAWALLSPMKFKDFTTANTGPAEAGKGGPEAAVQANRQLDPRPPLIK